MPGKVLIVDDTSTNRIILKVKLAAASYETFQASNGAEALSMARELRPDLILLDMMLPDMDGVELCSRLKSDEFTRGIPVVMVTAVRDDASRLRALRSGAEDVFWKPYSDVVLLARLRSVLRAREAEKELELRHLTYRDFGFADPAPGFAREATVALVAADPATAVAWRAALSGTITDRFLTVEPDKALLWPRDGVVPDVFLISADLDAIGDGLRLMSELRSQAATRYAAICVVLPDEPRDIAAIALDLGANDLIEARCDPVEVGIRIRAQIVRKRQADLLRESVADGLRLAMTDPLTGLHNRRYALPHLSRIAESARNSGRLFAVMVLDLDRFKRVNDTWGHAAGDAVLTAVADRLRCNLRAIDLAARIGGEEFLVALPDTTLEAARRAAERLRRTIEEEPVRLACGDQVRITVSVGLAMGGAPGQTEQGIDEVMALADRALMAAKAEGRNQVTVSRSAA